MKSLMTFARIIEILLVPAALGGLAWAAWAHVGWWLGLVIAIPAAIVAGGLLCYGIGILAIIALFRGR